MNYAFICVCPHLLVSLSTCVVIFLCPYPCMFLHLRVSSSTRVLICVCQFHEPLLLSMRASPSACTSAPVLCKYAHFVQDNGGMGDSSSLSAHVRLCICVQDGIRGRWVLFSHRVCKPAAPFSPSVTEILFFGMGMQR